MSEPAQYCITTKDLCLWYGKFQALKKITVNIRHGLITSLIGPSGCGKTTLLRCFNRVNERYGYVTTTGEIKVLDANIAGPLRFVRAAWHRWMREHGGVVLNVVSVGGMRPGPFIGAYNTSKAALIHLTRQLAQELAPGVRVNAVAPGLVKTDMARALWEPNEDAMARSHALGRLGVPDDIASAALFLVSNASSWMTGEVLVVDGGAGVSVRG